MSESLTQKFYSKYSVDGFLDAYVDFMTTADTHQDTYAESFHRDFFANWAKGKPLGNVRELKITTRPLLVGWSYSSSARQILGDWLKFAPNFD